jgi:hypothetical protein
MRFDEQDSVIGGRSVVRPYSNTITDVARQISLELSVF